MAIFLNNNSLKNFQVNQDLGIKEIYAISFDKNCTAICVSKYFISLALWFDQNIYVYQKHKNALALKIDTCTRSQISSIFFHTEDKILIGCSDGTILIIYYLN